jgi:hypothetical protein
MALQDLGVALRTSPIRLDIARSIVWFLLAAQTLIGLLGLPTRSGRADIQA